MLDEGVCIGIRRPPRRSDSRERKGFVMPSDEKACHVPVTVPNWACWAVVSAFSNTALIIVKTTAPPVAPLASLSVAESVLVVPGTIPMIVPTSAVVKVALGSLFTLAMMVLYMSVSPLNLRSFPPCPKPPVVMRVIAVEPKVTEAQLICAFVADM